MALYKSFWASKEKTEVINTWRARTIDLFSVESWEYVSPEYTRVFMDSGDDFTIKYPTEEFGDLVCAFVDGYGKLFTFNRN